MKTRKFWGFFLALTMILTINLFPAAQVDAASSRQVLLIQTDRPWGLNTNNDLLAGFQTSGVISGYDERTFAQVNAADFDLSGYVMVMIANSQNYSAYNATTKAKLEAYAQAGGVILFGACCHSTMPISINLPGDVEVSLDFQANNVIADPASSGIQLIPSAPSPSPPPGRNSSDDASAVSGGVSQPRPWRPRPAV